MTKKNDMHPITSFVLNRIKYNDHLTYTDAAAKAEISYQTFQNWRVGADPRIKTLDAVLKFLGFKLAVVPYDSIAELPNILDKQDVRLSEIEQALCNAALSNGRRQNDDNVKNNK